MGTNTITEKIAYEFSNMMLSYYFDKRNIEELEQYIDEKASWIGTGDFELCMNKLEALSSLEKEFLEYQIKFIVDETQFHYQKLTNVYGLVYGTLSATPFDKRFSKENIRFSAILSYKDECIKLIHLHFSHADMQQEPGEFYVKQEARQSNQTLQAGLVMKEHQLVNLTKNIPGGAHRCANDPYMSILSMSDGFMSMFGYTKEEIETQFDGKFINMVYPGDRAEMLRSTHAQLEKGTDIELEYRVLQKNGQPIWVLDKGRLMDCGSENECFYCILIDITERKRQQEELRLSLERHQVILNQATDIIFEWDILKDTLEFSTNWRKRFGYDAINSQISGRIPLSENIHPADMSAFLKIMKDTAAGVPYSETEFRIRNVNGIYFWSRIRATTQFSVDGCPIKAVGVIVDIDVEKKQKQKLIQQVQYDALTGIYNKATIQALVQQRMQGLCLQRNERTCYHSLMIIDVDYFKEVNDTYGHLCGDTVLSDVATALRGSVRSGDYVGRIGGDEFLIYFPEISDENSMCQKAEQLLKAIAMIHPKGCAHSISCSIGIVVETYEQNDFEDLYRRADRALYQQKHNGRNGYSVYQTFMQETFQNQVFTAVGNTIASDEGNVVDEWLAQYTFRTLYEAKNTIETINRLLEIIGRSFDVSRAYIFESSKDGKYCSNTFEWCGEGVSAQIDQLQNISYMDDLNDYLKNFNEQGVFYCDDIEKMHQDVYEILEPQGIHSILQCAMIDEGTIIGYVGFDECRENREWNEKQIHSFKLIADILSTFLMKYREKQKSN